MGLVVLGFICHMKASAAMPKYTLAFNYAHYYNYNTGASVDGSANNTTSATVKGNNGSNTTVKYYLYASTQSGTDILPVGGVISEKSITIEAEGKWQSRSMTVKNSAGEEVGSTYGSTLALNNLADGTYQLTSTMRGSGWNPNPRAYAWYSMSATSAFVVDSTAPTGTLYAGSSVISSGAKTKANYVRFVGQDSLSGIKACYVKTPSASTFVATTNDSQYSEEGTYSFYCVDKALNVSSTYTVTLDKSAPILSGTVAFSTTSDKSFTVTASDKNGVKLYYKTPELSTYKLASGSSYTISNLAKDGKYYFYAVDDLGNTSATAWVELKVSKPEVTIEHSKTDNGVRLTWSDTTYQVKVNGKSYNKGTWIKEEGNYTVVVTNSAQRTSTYQFSVDHDYQKKEVVNPTCTKQGYTLYVCRCCGATKKQDVVEAKGHIYEELPVQPTCTANGYIKHICKVCKEEYHTDSMPSLGHQYIDSVVEPTCTKSGGVYHSCEVCGYEYQSDIKLAIGHSYTSRVEANSTCTQEGERKHFCERCNDTYTTTIPATGHNYQIYSVETKDNITRRTYICTVCKDTYIQDMGDPYDKVTSYIEYLFELYSPYMIWVFLATTGIWSVVMGVMIITAQKNEEKEKAKKMLVNYIIGLVVIFVILVACPYLIKGIGILIT